MVAKKAKKKSKKTKKSSKKSKILVGCRASITLPPIPHIPEPQNVSFYTFAVDDNGLEIVPESVSVKSRPWWKFW